MLLMGRGSPSSSSSASSAWSLIICGISVYPTYSCGDGVAHMLKENMKESAGNPSMLVLGKVKACASRVDSHEMGEGDCSGVARPT